MEAPRSESSSLARPLLIVSGYRDPGIAACSLKARLSSISTNPEFLIPVTLGTARSFDDCADRIIGPENAAPLGTKPWWLTSHLPLFAHHVAFFEKRFLADIGPRLRGQAPLSKMPPPPIPIDPGKSG